MKKLSLLMIIELGIDEMFRGKLWAYTPVIDEKGIGLGIAVANEAGYNPIPLQWCNGEKYDEVREHADELNAERGLSSDCSMRVVMSTMAAQNAKKHRSKASCE